MIENMGFVKEMFKRVKAIVVVVVDGADAVITGDENGIESFASQRTLRS